MVVLKKLKSATLMEAIVATVLIVIVFVVASLVLNNLVLNTFSKNTHSIETRLNELEYQVKNGLIKLPYIENYRDWTISIQTEQIKSEQGQSIKAVNESGDKQIKRERIYAE